MLVVTTAIVIAEYFALLASQLYIVNCESVVDILMSSYDWLHSCEYFRFFNDWKIVFSFMFSCFTPFSSMTVRVLCNPVVKLYCKLYCLLPYEHFHFPVPHGRTSSYFMWTVTAYIYNIIYSELTACNSTLTRWLQNHYKRSHLCVREQWAICLVAK